ncbi:MAG: MarR family transcriptional regulator [Deltaproteobacteria bacterium]|jgi:DNA-binding MarR family transcriptional regulator
MTSYYEDCIVFLLAKAYQSAHSLFKRKLEPHGLTPVQNLILEVLWEQEAISIGDISRRIRIDYATLSSILDRMVASDWVKKERNPADRRSWQVYLSDKGRDMKETLLAAQKATNRKMTARLSEPERLLLFRLLNDLREPEKEEES